MKTTRKRKRRVDCLATATSVRAVCEELRNYLPKLIPNKEKKLFSLLNAVRHVVRNPDTDSTLGRPSQWRKEDLLEVAYFLQKILDRETASRVSISSFVGLYLRILQFPLDLKTALESGVITLQEATIIARLSHRNLVVSPAKAEVIRRDTITNHIKTQASQNALRQRIKEILGEGKIVSTEMLTTSVQIADGLLKVDPEDKYHLFYEQIKNLFYAMREIKPEQIDDQLLMEFTEAADQLSTIIYSIQQRHQQKQSASKLVT